MTDMNPNLNLDDVKCLRERCDAWLAEGRIWPEILEDLEAEGNRPLDMQYVMRGMDAWIEQARALKADGWPYEDLVMYLSNILATWQDVAWALLKASLRPADMLRAVLPAAAGSEFQRSVIQLAMDQGDAIEECRRVAAWWVDDELDR